MSSKLAQLCSLLLFGYNCQCMDWGSQLAAIPLLGRSIFS